MADAPAPARASASIILVRDAPDGLETFMVRRHERSHVAPNAYVFPGGTVRSDDLALRGVELDGLADELQRRSDAVLDPTSALGLYACGVRELFEEAGVLLAYDKERLVEVSAADQQRQERLAAARLALQAHELSLDALLAEWRLQPACDALVPFSHWVTPLPVPVRFDTWFFVAAMPPLQEALHCTIETSEGVWQRPVRLLDGGYGIVFPTQQHLFRLSAFARVADLLAFAAHKPIRTVQPDLVQSPTGVTPVIRSDLVDVW